MKTPNEILLIAQAEGFAKQAHAGQKRKYIFTPYFEHPAAVADILRVHGAGANLIAAGFLHDVIEDCPEPFTTHEERARRVIKLCEKFPIDVVDLVQQVTNVAVRSDGNRARRVELNTRHLELATPEGRSLKLADFLHNEQSIVERDPSFAAVWMEEKRVALEYLRCPSIPMLYEIASKRMEAWDNHREIWEDC